MKNIALAVGALAIIIVLIFMFASNQGNRNDTIIPSPVLSASPTMDLLNNESASQSANLPFPLLKTDEIEGRKVAIATSKGSITIQLFGDAPMAASNFLYLVSKHFYNGLVFHRREEGFVIQGGDPRGDGTGGPGYSFADEPVSRDYKRGIVAMANAGPNTNGSQFFIMLRDASQLPKQYTIFGQVVEGMDAVDKIAVGDKMTKLLVEQ